MAENIENLEFKEISEIPVTENKSGIYAISVDSKGEAKAYPLDNFNTNDEVDGKLKDKADANEFGMAQKDIATIKQTKAERAELSPIRIDVSAAQTDIVDLQASKLDVSALANLQIAIKRYKDSVANVGDLPITDSVEGDGRIVDNDKDSSGQSFVHVFDGKSWSRTPYTKLPSDIVVSKELSLLNYQTKNLLLFPYVSVGKYIRNSSYYENTNSYVLSREQINSKLQDVLSINNMSNSTRHLYEVYPNELSKFTFRGKSKFGLWIYPPQAVVGNVALFYSDSNFNSVNIDLKASIWQYVQLDCIVPYDMTSLRLRLYFSNLTSGSTVKISGVALVDERSNPITANVDYNPVVDVEPEDCDFITTSANVYSGLRKSGYYLDYNTHNEVAFNQFGISNPIRVKENTEYTVSHTHTMFLLDAEERPVAVWRDGEYNKTFKTPFGCRYIEPNINLSWVDYCIAEGDTLPANKKFARTFAQGFTVGGDVANITFAQLSPELQSMLNNMLNNTSVLDGTNIQNDTIAKTKLTIALQTEISNKLGKTDALDGSLLTNESVGVSSLSPAIISLINASGGGSITNNADDFTIKQTADNKLFVNTLAFGVIYTENETIEDLITRIGGQMVILYLKGDVTVSANIALPSNIQKIIYSGGKLVNAGANILNITVSNTEFECGLYQIFDNIKVIGTPRGVALPHWWGAFPDGATNVRSQMDLFAISDFMEWRFPEGVYVAYIDNSKDGRVITFDDGAVIDGVIHIAYGNITARTYCKNTIVRGVVVATIRVGGAMIDGLQIPEGIRILDYVPNKYPNQTAEGGNGGVHWHFGCQNIIIGHTIIETVKGRQYGYSIDSDTAVPLRPNNIYTKSLTIGDNNQIYGLQIVDSDNITFGNVSIKEGWSRYGVIINNAKSILINGIDVLSNVSADNSASVMVQNSENTELNRVIAKGSAFSHIFFNGCTNIKMSNSIIKGSGDRKAYSVHVQNCNACLFDKIYAQDMTTGVRTTDTKALTVVQLCTKNVTTPVSDYNAEYKILTQFENI